MMPNNFYKNNPEDKIWWVDTDAIGIWEFSFDRKTIFNMYEDYPYKLTKEQRAIFDKEDPDWAEYFRDRNERADFIEKAKGYGYSESAIKGLLQSYDEMRAIDPKASYDDVVLIEQAVHAKPSAALFFEQEPMRSRLFEVMFGEISNYRIQLYDYELVKSCGLNFFDFTEEDVMRCQYFDDLPMDWQQYAAACIDKYFSD